jgi:hypothetical protein
MDMHSVPRSTRPGKVQAIGIMNVVDGLVNIVWSPVLGSIIFGFGAMTLGIGCLLLPLAILPMVTGVLALISGIRLLTDTPPRVRPSSGVPILQIVNVLSGNVISLGVGIAALVLYGDPEVKDYFSEKL